ncbi:MAG TPA: COX15/CtaA family protein [Acidimicrobiia bacterium]|nr:COX15/CtaA family protein [Acidimicrobiia bacterium]
MTRTARYAWFTLVFNIGVILLGALVRATGSGAGCGRSWPTCRGEVVPELSGATAIEFSHRAASGVALVLVVVRVVLVWREAGSGEPARTGAVLSLTAIVGEALIGAMIVLAEWVAEDASVARVVAVPLHLVNTLFLLAALTLTGFWLSGGRRLAPRSRPLVWRWVVLGGVAMVLLASTGAVTALADTLFPKGASDLRATEEAHFLTDLRLVHPILAVVAATIGWWVSGRSPTTRSRAGKTLPLLVGLMLLTGAVNIALGVPVWMQLVHLLLADILWITYILASAQALQVHVEVPAPAP